MPEEIDGNLEIKVTATDRAGHRGRHVTDGVRVAGNQVVRGGASTREADKTAEHREPRAAAGGDLRGCGCLADCGRARRLVSAGRASFQNGSPCGATVRVGIRTGPIVALRAG